MRLMKIYGNFYSVAAAEKLRQWENSGEVSGKNSGKDCGKIVVKIVEKQWFEPLDSTATQGVRSHDIARKRSFESFSSLVIRSQFDHTEKKILGIKLDP